MIDFVVGFSCRQKCPLLLPIRCGSLCTSHERYCKLRGMQLLIRILSVLKGSSKLSGSIVDAESNAEADSAESASSAFDIISKIGTLGGSATELLQQLESLPTCDELYLNFVDPLTNKTITV